MEGGQWQMLVLEDRAVISADQVNCSISPHIMMSASPGRQQTQRPIK